MGLFSALINWNSAKSNRKFQAQQSATAHQREVADLRAAGLNPILSAGGSGASTPSGSMATTSGPIGEDIQSAKKVTAEIKNITAQTRKTAAETEYTEGVTANIGKTVGQGADTIRATAKETGKQIGSKIYDLLNPPASAKSIRQGKGKIKRLNQKQTEDLLQQIRRGHK